MAWAAVIGSVVAAGVGAAASRSSNRAAARANNAAADATQLQAQIAAEQWDRYRELYAPLEEELVNDARNYDSPENYARAAGEASATVSEQYGKARDRLTRTPGLDPSSASYQASMVGLDLAQAATDATQQNVARKGVADTAYLRKQSAVALGKGLDSAAASGLNAAANSNMALSQANAHQASLEAQAAGGLANRLFTPGNLRDWFTPSSAPGGAGSMTSNGSVQGNPDYIYDI